MRLAHRDRRHGADQLVPEPQPGVQRDVAGHLRRASCWRCVVVLISFEVPGILEHRRVTGEIGRLRVLPWALIVAAALRRSSRGSRRSSRATCGASCWAWSSCRTDTGRGRGSRAAAGALVDADRGRSLAWLGLGWVRRPTAPIRPSSNVAAQTALAAIVVSGLEAVAFGLMPFRFMPGVAIYRWNRLVWAVLFGASLFAFFHILIGPTSGYLVDPDRAGLAGGDGRLRRLRRLHRPLLGLVPIPPLAGRRGRGLAPSGSQDRVGGAIDIGLGGRPAADADAHGALAVPGRAAHPCLAPRPGRGVIDLRG